MNPHPVDREITVMISKLHPHFVGNHAIIRPIPILDPRTTTSNNQLKNVLSARMNQTLDYRRPSPHQEWPATRWHNQKAEASV